MNEFPPSRQRGLAIHIALALLLGLLSLGALWLTFQTAVGLIFALYLLVFIFTGIPVPVLAYRIYALLRANYLLDRNNLRLVWGLRIEDIPITDVEWVRPLKGLPAPLRLPWFRLPGGILGVTSQPDIGRVEFLAADTRNLVLVATAHRVYAISPENPAAFLAAFQKTIEMGSLQPLQGLSQYPSFVVAHAWESPFVRYVWSAGAFLNIGLLLWVTVLMPSIKRVALGFGPTGRPLEPVAGAQLILLPVLSALLFLTGLGLGLFFFRKPELRVLSLAIWASGTISTLLFLIAVFFILNTPL